MFPYDIKSDREDRDTVLNEEDNSAYAPLAAVIDTAFTWGSDYPPNHPWNQTVIYETHVKDLTMLHPGKYSRGSNIVKDIQ